MSQQNRLKVVIDDKIPFIKGVLEPYAEVKYIPGNAIAQNDLHETDALVIRTRTKCNASLLENTAVEFIASATIGKDHIDEDYCLANGITFTNAPGCNAGSVAQYILSALAFIAENEKIALKDKVLGIVGVGHVGSLVAYFAKEIGMRVLLNDPPRERREGPSAFVPLDTLLRGADIVTLHVPLNRTGADATFHMADASFLNKMKDAGWLINSSRGGVADTRDLKRFQKKIHTVLDVWENEPFIDQELMQQSDLATPHIAGYSVDGKANGTKAAVNALAQHFDLPLKSWSPDVPEPEQQIINLSDETPHDIFKAIEHTYDIQKDSNAFKKAPGKFEAFRGNYSRRWEFHHYRVQTGNKDIQAALHKLTFKQQ